MLEPALASAAAPRAADAIDQRVVLHDVPWEQYEALLTVRGERAAPRMTYLRGELEFMSPSLDHDLIKTTIGRLLEAWTDLLGLDLQGFGSWTVRSKDAQRGAEADECYTLGGPDRPERPDLAIEVVWTSGGLDKLDVWRGLRVREVWMWEDDAIHVFALREDGYAAITGSELLPQIDLVLLARLARLRQTEALRTLREHLQTR